MPTVLLTPIIVKIIPNASLETPRINTNIANKVKYKQIIEGRMGYTETYGATTI